MSGCDVDWGRPYADGRLVPDFRFKVTFPEPLSKVEVFMRFEHLAELAGFPNYIGKPISPEMLEPTAKWPSAFDFHPDENSDELYSITLGWNPYDVKMPTSVFVIFSDWSVEDFTQKEWLIFKEWKESYLPGVFPGSVIEVDRHPVVFTNKDDMLEISRATGIPIPQDLLERYTENLEGTQIR